MAILLAPVAGGAWFRQPGGQFPPPPKGAAKAPEANPPDKKNAQQQKDAISDAANAERRHELTAETAELLLLANQLKAEVDKTNEDMLSLSVIRKAEKIEKLAHDVRLNGNAQK
ncbi:MAG TPA: hypothetical protein VMV57_09785 [Terracidiphilus sp.]|nr:hypothetical protein [Terracidiphilus sp.]